MTQPPAELVARLRAAGCVFAEDEARVLCEAAPPGPERDALVERRAQGEPLEHLVGWVEFAGLRLAVTPGVFVPRRRTELMAAEAARLLRRGSAGRPPVVLELCCGAAAVAAALGASVPGAELHAADIDPAAVRCAARNLAPWGGRVYAGDLDAPLPADLAGRVDVVVANAPYVPHDEVRLMPPEARLHEPAIALDGGADGLDVQRRVAAAEPRWLRSGGHLLVETSERQAERTARILAGHGFATRVARDDDLDATVVVGAVSTLEGGPRPPGAARASAPAND